MSSVSRRARPAGADGSRGAQGWLSPTPGPRHWRYPSDDTPLPAEM